MRWFWIFLLALPAVAASMPVGKTSFYSWFYGIKVSYPQLLAVSWTYLGAEDPGIKFKPFVQLEPGVFGGKVSGGLGSVAGFPILTSLRIKAAYMTVWADADGWVDPGYGYLGPELEAMTILPSAHLGLYYPLGTPARLASLRPSAGIGIGF